MPGRAPQRPRVLFVTTHWGLSPDESNAATRLLAGAVARSAEVHVAHLKPEPRAGGPFPDSVFRVHELALHGRKALRAGILRAALAAHDGGQRVPAVASAVLDRFAGEAEGVGELLEAIAPQAVVLAGSDQPYDVSLLGQRGAPGRPRVTVVPLIGDVRRAGSAPVRRLVELADAVGTAHPGEQRALARLAGERTVPLKFALSLNRGAAANRLFGVRYFGRYVLSLRCFPPDSPRYERSATHEVLRGAVAPLSVAEVDGDRWRISDAENTLELPVSPSRVNLWRLMAHAEATVDLRPPGPLGRETLESMLLGTPVVVADDSAARDHVAAADGGLWYRDLGEMFDALRTVISPRLRDAFAAQARSYAEATHGSPREFVAHSADFVLGAARG